MAELTAYTDFTIQAAIEQYTEEVELILLPELEIGAACRRLRYPNDVLAPLDYPDNPDTWTNFDSVPLTARPLFKGELTIASAKLARWGGYLQDRPVREVWEGQKSTARMTMYFIRRFLEYFLNPPASGYITWEPRDLNDKKYNIVIEDFTVDGAEVNFAFLAHSGDVAAGVISFAFRLIGEAT